MSDAKPARQSFNDTDVVEYLESLANSNDVDVVTRGRQRDQTVFVVETDDVDGVLDEVDEMAHELGAEYFVTDIRLGLVVQPSDEYEFDG